MSTTPLYKSALPRSINLYPSPAPLNRQVIRSFWHYILTASCTSSLDVCINIVLLCGFVDTLNTSLTVVDQAPQHRIPDSALPAWPETLRWIPAGPSPQEVTPGGPLAASTFWKHHVPAVQTETSSTEPAIIALQGRTYTCQAVSGDTLFCKATSWPPQTSWQLRFQDTACLSLSPVVDRDLGIIY